MDFIEIKLYNSLKDIYSGTNILNPDILKINLFLELLSYFIKNIKINVGKTNEN